MNIQLEVNDDLVSQLGKEAITNKIKKWLEWEELRMLATSIHEGIKDAGLDANEISQTARSQAWEEYKKNNLPFLSNL
ncbi:MAG: hypothetical protein COZ18_14485 [Flexibacter sp. CG_4_10_14_3_um_filter_32_15]|nr:MAG: hypothetical protein COZ18_14485 [Flexibacter sp. CG_4_10_14_3_um_filter_32_15]